MSDQEINDGIQAMLVNRKSELLLRDSFSILGVNKSNIPSRIVITVISFLLGYKIMLINITDIMSEIIPFILDGELALFGIIFTGYALFQALLNEKFLVMMIEDVKKDKNTGSKNKLHSTNLNFIYLMFQFLFGIFVSALTKIALMLMPENYCMFKSMWVNNSLAMLLLFLYFYQVMVISWRLISFMSNMFQYFNVFAVTTYLSIREKEGGSQ